MHLMGLGKFFFRFVLMHPLNIMKNGPVYHFLNPSENLLR